MKKFLFSAAALLSLSALNAQSAFLEKTCYRGAFAPAPTPMWTDSWTEWDPNNVNYPAPTVTISSNIASNTTWSTGQTYLLQGPIYVTGNSILTIQPGVIIRGQSGVGGSGLFITQGSRLMAVGTKTAPIVFTSDQAPGQRFPGDWGGIVLLGRANNNNPSGTNNIEGIAPTPLTLYGGGTSPNDNDNSGDLQYVRIEYGGYIYAPDKEINGLTLGAVGNGTKIDHVQCSFVNDDAFEFFGGTVNCKHLVAYRCVDDNFDTDNGYRGTVQFCLGVRDPQLADPTYANSTGASTSEAFESDNDPSGTTAGPVTAALFSNVTDIGPLRGVSTASTHPGFRRGARIRRNSALKIINSIFLDHKTRALYIDGTLSENNAAGTSTNTLLFKNNILANYGQQSTEHQAPATAFNGTMTTWLRNNGNDTLPFIGGSTSNSILVNAYNFTSPDYRPFQGSIAMSGASFTDAIVASNTSTVYTAPLSQVPGQFCIGTSFTTSPATFMGSSTITSEYCSLTWTASPGVVISNSTSSNPNFTISTIGTFTISMIVSDGSGVQNIMNTVTTNTCLDVSIKNNPAILMGLNIFPNPSSETAEINFNSQTVSKVSISIIDLTGKNVLEIAPFSNQIGENNYQINTSELNAGLYFVTINANGRKETVKLIVNH